MTSLLVFLLITIFVIQLSCKFWNLLIDASVEAGVVIEPFYFAIPYNLSIKILLVVNPNKIAEILIRAACSSLTQIFLSKGSTVCVSDWFQGIQIMASYEIYDYKNGRWANSTAQSSWDQWLVQLKFWIFNSMQHSSIFLTKRPSWLNLILYHKN